ncbi:MAG: methyltransferase domain-containing protein [Acidobacteriota bacterium]
MRDTTFRLDHYLEIEPGYYDKVYRRGRGVQWFWHHHRLRLVESKLPVDCKSLLDLGCGPGTFLGNLKRPVETALGIDLAEPQIAYAQEHYSRPGFEFRVADVRDAALERRFDAVVSVEVIEHLPPAEVGGFLRDAYAVLRPGGHLILSTPNAKSLWPLLEWLVSLVGPVDYRQQHLGLFNRKSLTRAVAEAGFEPVSAETFFVAAPFVAPLSRRLAAGLLELERRVLPALGAELLLVARRPL